MTAITRALRNGRFLDHLIKLEARNGLRIVLYLGRKVGEVGIAVGHAALLVAAFIVEGRLADPTGVGTLLDATGQEPSNVLAGGRTIEVHLNVVVEIEELVVELAQLTGSGGTLVAARIEELPGDSRALLAVVRNLLLPEELVEISTRHVLAFEVDEDVPVKIKFAAHVTSLVAASFSEVGPGAGASIRRSLFAFHQIVVGRLARDLLVHKVDHGVVVHISVGRTELTRRRGNLEAASIVVHGTKFRTHFGTVGDLVLE